MPPCLQPEKVDEEGLEKAIADRSTPLVVDFFATWYAHAFGTAWPCRPSDGRPVNSVVRPVVLLAWPCGRCGPCVLVATELEKVAEQMGEKVRVLKVDVDKNPAISSALKIEALPTLIFVPKEDNKPALRAEGFMPADQIIQILSEVGKEGQDAPAAAA